MSRRGPRLVALLLVTSTTCGLVGACESCGCGGETGVAELVHRDGTVDRDHDEAREAWETADLGARFDVGDGLRTGDDSEARAALARGGGLRLESRTLVRFLDARPDTPGPGLTVLTGAAELEAGEQGVTFETQIGLARLQAGTRVRLQAVEGGTRFEVLIGQARLDTGREQLDLTADDEAITVSIGGALLDAPPPEVARPTPDAGDGEVAIAGVEASVHGRGAQVRAPGEEDLRDLAPGATTIATASLLRVARGSRVDLASADRRVSVHGPAEVVVGGAGAALVTARHGRIGATSGGAEVAIQVAGGTIVLRPSARASLDVGARATDVTSEAGTVELRGVDGTEVLSEGERGRLEAPEDEEGPVATGEITAQPGSADFTISAGESAMVHDPAPPTHVRIRTGCAGEATVEVTGTSAATYRGGAAVTVRADTGASRYRVRCDGAADGGRGVLRIMRDAGVAQLPRSTTRNTVDADGRRYTVLYQNRLPVITFRWSGAPAGGEFVLHVSGARSITQRSATPSVTVPSGQLREGTYQFHFSGGGRRSPTTTLRVGFDNAARTAYVREPPERGFSPGSVRVSGAALPGSTVHVGGVTLTLDDQLRFEGTVTAPGGQDALVIRVTHPGTGSHIYLRHFGGASP